MNVLGSSQKTGGAMGTGIGQAFEEDFGGQSKAPVPLRDHGGPLSKHGVKMSFQRHCPGYGMQ